MGKVFKESICIEDVKSTFCTKEIILSKNSGDAEMPRQNDLTATTAGGGRHILS